MKRVILISMLTAAGMFAQSATPAQPSAPAASQSGSATKSTQTSTTKKHKKAKKTTAPASNKKVNKKAVKPSTVTPAPAKSN